MRRSSDTTEEANVLQKLSIEAACPLPAAVTGGSIGPHARRNYGEGKAGRRPVILGPLPHPASWKKRQPASGSATLARRRRRGRSRTERLQESFALRIELLGLERQSRPGPRHVGQDGAHPQVRRAISHLPAFDGTLSALDGSNHRHPAERPHRPRGRRSHYTTTATGVLTWTAVGMKKFDSRESDTRPTTARWCPGSA